MFKFAKTLFSLALFVFLCGTALTVNAQTTFTVTKTADTNDGVCDADCSLREAVQAANNDPVADIINFDASLNNQTIVLTIGEITINTSVEISNSGTNTITISGNNNNRIFYISAGNVTINNLIIRNGNAIVGAAPLNYGGAILVDGGSLTLRRSTLRNNTSNFTSGALELRSVGPHKIIESLIYLNTATDVALGRGICGGFAVNGANVYLVNSTVAQNEAVNGEGGGLCVLNQGVLQIRNSTIANNSATLVAGGIDNFDLGQIDVANTIVANNTAASSPDVFNEIDPDPTNSSILNSLGYNLIGSTTSADNVIWQSTDIVNQAANLAPLGNNGGPTLTYALFSNSPAVNAGNNSLAVDPQPVVGGPLTNDQRGPSFARIVGSSVDIGAFERGVPTAAGARVSGTAYTPNNRRAANVSIHLTSASTGQTATVTTNARGNFKFRDVKVNEIYIISVSNTRWIFVPQILQVNERIDNLQIQLTR